MTGDLHLDGCRVLLIGPYPPPFGGIASHLVNLIPGLSARGAADVALVSFGEADAVEQEQGATLYRVNVRKRAARIPGPAALRGLHAAWRELGSWQLGTKRLIIEGIRAAVVAKVAARHRSNVVSFYQTNESLSLLPLRRMWGRSRGIVLTILGEAYDTPEFFEPRAAGMARLLSASDARLSSSLHCARSLQHLGVMQPIEAIYYGVDLRRFDVPHLREPFRAKHGMGPEDAAVLYMGRFNEEMGLDRVLDVIPLVLAATPRVRFVLAGAKGPLTDSAAAVAHAHGDRVTVLTNVPFDDQPALYAASDLVLAPTRDQHACMGMAIKEAMAAGRPAVASNAGGIPEAIADGVTGVLVPLDESLHVDRDLFTRAIGRLAGDPALCRQMGAAARERAIELFSNERTVDRIATVFRAVAP